MAQRIQKIEIKNFKKLKDVKTEINGNNVYLIGANGQGKTTFIDAVFGNMPGQPLNNESKRGLVKIELDDYIAEFKFSERSQKPKLNIYTKNGVAQAKPATLFKELFGVVDFDIDNFLSMSDQKKIDYIKEIIGIDWTDLDDDYKRLYEERSYFNKRDKEYETLIGDNFYDPEMKEIDVSGIQVELSEAAKHNSEVVRIKDGVEPRELRIKEIQAQIIKLKGDQLKIEKEIEGGRKYLESKKEIDVSNIEDKLNAAIDHNKLCVKNDENGKYRKESLEVQNQLEAIDEQIHEIQDVKKAELEGARMPIKGLTFHDDKLYLDGLPFESDQTNTAKRIIAGLELNYFKMKEVKIARIEGSLLDKNSMAEVEKWAEEKGIQLFVEIVDREGDELKIEVKES